MVFSNKRKVPVRNKFGKGVVFFVTLCSSFSALANNTVVATQAKNNGVVVCASAVENAANFIIGDRDHASHSVWHSGNPNGRIFTSMTSKGYSDGDAHVTIIAAPVSDGKCDTTYVETFAVERTCISARETVYKDWQFYGELNGTIALENQAGTVNIYLTSQGSGNVCLVSRRETVFN